MATLVAGKDEIVGRMRQAKYLDLADAYDIELVHGDAHLVDGPALEVDGRRDRRLAGLTEAEAQAQGQQTDARVLELAAIPRAIVSRSTRGLVKLVAEQGAGRLLGVHLLADGAGDAILAAVYAIGAGMTVQQMADAWNPYLTIGEAVHLTAQSFTRDPATLSCCA